MAFRLNRKRADARHIYGKTDAQGNFRLTVSGVRRFFKERSWTPEARDKLLHDLGVRYRRNGEVYVVPV